MSLSRTKASNQHFASQNLNFNGGFDGVIGSQ